jgi:hypothetical protein
MMSEPFGEVIASDSQVLQVECHRLYGAPTFGSFVRAECLGSEMQFYGVVTRVSTTPFDGNRVVQAHGMPPGELEQRKPHLVDLLRTTFDVRIVGYGKGDARVAGTPPTPPRLHCFVYPATEEEVRGVTGSPAFLRPLAQSVDVSLEDLLVCAIQAAQQAWGAAAPLVTWGKFLARLLRHDYLTLEGVLQRLSPPAAVSRVPYTPPTVNGTSNGTRRPPIYEQPLPIVGTTPRPRDEDPFADV